VRRLPLVHRGADRLLRAAAASAARRRAAGGRPLPPAGRRPHRRQRLVRPTHLRPTRRPPAAHGPTRSVLEGMVTLSDSPATKHVIKSRLALDGPVGSGKTYTALLTARALAGSDGRVAVIDTERRSASLYADRFAFDTLALDSYDP